MYRTCLYCSSNLGTNATLETLPIGHRIAFDEAKGRLWVVCHWCAKWNLVPFDTRLETIDSCARLFRETRTRYSTDNIGLARHRSGLDLVRIGPALRPEFAAWRYGYRLARRRRWQGVPLVGTLLRLFEPAVAGEHSPVLRDPWTDQLVRVPRATLTAVTLVATDDWHWRLEVPYSSDPQGFLTPIDAPALPSIRDVPTLGLFRDQAIFPALGRILPAIDRMRPTRGQTQAAVQLLERVSHPEALFEYVAGKRLKYVTQRRFVLSDVGQDIRLALEMGAHEETERRAMAGELKLLERDWQAAEALAAIADGLAIQHAAP